MTEPGQGVENESQKFWRSYSQEAPLKGTGLQEHEDPTLTDEQKADMNAPHSDFTAKLEEAVRAHTPSIPIGKLEK